MSGSRTAELYLADLGRELGRNGLAPGPDGEVTLILERGLALELRVGDDDSIQLESVLGGSGPMLPDSFLRHCLAGNFLWQGTQGATLLAEPGSARLYLRQRFDLAATDYAAFRAGAERFLNTAEAWQRACLAALDGQASPAAASPVAEPFLIIRG